MQDKTLKVTSQETDVKCSKHSQPVSPPFPCIHTHTAPSRTYLVIHSFSIAFAQDLSPSLSFRAMPHTIPHPRPAVNLQTIIRRSYSPNDPERAHTHTANASKGHWRSIVCGEEYDCQSHMNASITVVDNKTMVSTRRWNVVYCPCDNTHCEDGQERIGNHRRSVRI